ncbi:MAG: hypothetical protein ACOZF0_04450 [Thermodesulfobacteriota bacterium]
MDALLNESRRLVNRFRRVDRESENRMMKPLEQPLYNPNIYREGAVADPETIMDGLSKEINSALKAMPKATSKIYVSIMHTLC